MLLAKSLGLCICDRPDEIDYALSGNDGRGYLAMIFYVVTGKHLEMFPCLLLTQLPRYEAICVLLNSIHKPYFTSINPRISL